MRIILIKPNIGIREYSLRKDNASMEPLQLGVLAALTPPGIEVRLVDDRLEDIPYDEPADLIALTVETFTARRSYEICAAYRERGHKAKLLLGGMHPTLIPEEAARHADVIMTGDAENSWAAMLDDLQSGRLKDRYDGECASRAQNGLLVRRDLYRGKRYLPISLLQFSRGCVNHCRYCASGAYFDHRHHCRPIGDVLAEIKNQKRKLLFFVDDNIVADREAAKELFRALILLKVKWVSQASLDMLEDEELMYLMAKSGCLGNVIGFESITPGSVAGMGKSVNERFVKGGYAEAVEQLRRWGQQTWAAFTVGHDGDTLPSIAATYRFALQNKFTFAAYNILMPYPGTPLYEQFEAEGRHLYDGKWWLHDDYRFNHAAFKPKQMSADALTQISFWCRRNFNRPSSVLHRLLEPRTNLRNPYRFFTYLLYNPLFRKEVFEKQGIRFGYNEDVPGRKG